MYSGEQVQFFYVLGVKGVHLVLSAKGSLVAFKRGLILVGENGRFKE